MELVLRGNQLRLDRHALRFLRTTVRVPTQTLRMNQIKAAIIASFSASIDAYHRMSRRKVMGETWGGERVSQLVPWNPLLHVSHHFAHLRFLVVDQVTSIWFLSPKAGFTYQAKN